MPIDNIPNTLVDPGQVLNGDWVLDDGVEKQVTFKPLKDGRQHISLQDLRDKYRQLGRQVEKINKYGRNLRPHNYTFNLDDVKIPVLNYRPDRYKSQLRNPTDVWRMFWDCGYLNSAVSLQLRETDTKKEG